MVSSSSTGLGFLKVNDNKYINPHSVVQVRKNTSDGFLPITNNTITISLDGGNYFEIDSFNAKKRGLTLEKVVSKVQEAATTGQIIDLYS